MSELELTPRPDQDLVIYGRWNDHLDRASDVVSECGGRVLVVRDDELIDAFWALAPKEEDVPQPTDALGWMCTCGADEEIGDECRCSDGEEAEQDATIAHAEGLLHACRAADLLVIELGYQCKRDDSAPRFLSMLLGRRRGWQPGDERRRSPRRTWLVSPTWLTTVPSCGRADTDESRGLYMFLRAASFNIVGTPASPTDEATAEVIERLEAKAGHLRDDLLKAAGELDDHSTEAQVVRVACKYTALRRAATKAQEGPMEARLYLEACVYGEPAWGLYNRLRNRLRDRTEYQADYYQATKTKRQDPAVRAQRAEQARRARARKKAEKEQEALIKKAIDAI